MKKWIMYIVGSFLIFGFAIGLTINNVVLDSKTSDKIVAEATATSQKNEDVASDIITAHYEREDAQAKADNLRQLEIDIREELDILIASKDEVLIQNVLTGMRCEMYGGC